MFEGGTRKKSQCIFNAYFLNLEKSKKKLHVGNGCSNVCTKLICLFMDCTKEKDKMRAH
jgi:hypothetical protein